jgi:PAS domain S-box-containing protein
MSGDYFRQAFYTSSAAKAIVVRATGEFLDSNDAFSRLVGYGRDQVIGHEALDLAVWEDEGERARLFRRLETESYVQDLGARIKTQSGEVRSLLITAEPVQLDDRPCIIITALDVTAQKRAEVVLQETEATLHAIIDSTSDLVWSVEPQSFGLVTFNRAMYDYFRHNRNIQIAPGMRPHELFPTQDYVDQWLELYTRALTAGAYSTEYTTYANAHILELSLNPLRRDGEVFGIAAFGKDVTELRAAMRDAQELNRTLEQRIAQRTAELQRLYDSAPTGYHSLDANGRVVMMNQTELKWLGYTRDEVIGRPAQDFLSPVSREIFAAEFPNYIQRGWLHDFEIEFQRKDGSAFSVLVTSEALYDEQGGFVMSRATVFDNTQRKAIDDALRQANLEMQRAVRIKDEFLANMSHELRTPLTSVLTLNEVLLDHIYGPLTEQQEKALGNIDASARHLLALINDLLDLSKIEAGKLELHWEEVDVAAACQASLFFVRERALKDQIEIRYESNCPDAKFKADPKRIKQMLVNLLSNAVKFTPAGGHVTLRVTVDEAEHLIQFAVEDTGVGITPEGLAQLFQPFKQLDSILVRQHQGTGLGLALAKQLAEQHGGSVTATSGGPGLGSCFTITLPYRVQ